VAIGALIASCDSIGHRIEIAINAKKCMTPRIFSVLLATCMSPAALGQNAKLVSTFSKAIPAEEDSFGSAVAFLDANRVIIGAWGDDTVSSNAGAAYLFATNGTLITTFTNPTPGYYDFFGAAVATLDSDRVIIGAYGNDVEAIDVGAAYLFSADGVLLKTFTHPSPEANCYFGCSVASVGNDGVLIGAWGDNTAAVPGGKAYLFQTNGMLQTTFTNPTPAIGDQFGYSVAALGRTHVFISAVGDQADGQFPGVVYLFNTDGALVATFNNPAPEGFDRFGHSLTAVGNDRVLIGAPEDSTGAHQSGAAYLFSTNGALLKAFSSPDPAYRDLFGYSVAALGKDQVVIGAIQRTASGVVAGAAYRFSTNGTLLTTFTKPTPANFESFGMSVAAHDTDVVLIGAQSGNGLVQASGTAHLFALLPPTLALNRGTQYVSSTISWSPDTPGFVLQETGALSPANWTNSPSGSANPAITPTTEPARFFRLIKP
jgi:hypothetical protein